MNNCDLPSEALTNKKLIRLWHTKEMASAMLLAAAIVTKHRQQRIILFHIFVWLLLLRYILELEDLPRAYDFADRF